MSGLRAISVSRAVCKLVNDLDDIGVLCLLLLLQAYMNKVRSLKFNLSKADNPDLRRDALTGMVTPQRLVNMTAEEMAPDRVRGVLLW